MVQGIVIGVGLFVLISFPFGVLALHQLFLSFEHDSATNREEISPPSPHDVRPGRTVPGHGNRRAD